MRVLSCFKVVPDLEMLTEEDWQVVNNTVDTCFVKTELNCFDESALEIALKLSDAAEKIDLPVQLTGLSIGWSGIDPHLRKLMALQFDQTVRIDCEEDLRFMPERVAELIAAYVSREPQDVILMGWQSGVGDNAQTPLVLTEMLEWPCISQVVSLELDSDGQLKVTNQVDGGYLVQTVQSPVVLTVGNAQSTLMRVPTLKDKMKYGKRPSTILAAAELTTNGEASNNSSGTTRLLGLETINRQRNTEILSEGTAEEKAHILFDRFLKQRIFKR
jgi:electron transfer flavoprotein alpha/beta subunit